MSFKNLNIRDLDLICGEINEKFKELLNVYSNVNINFKDCYWNNFLKNQIHDEHDNPSITDADTDNNSNRNCNSISVQEIDNFFTQMNLALNAFTPITNEKNKNKMHSKENRKLVATTSLSSLNTIVDCTSNTSCSSINSIGKISSKFSTDNHNISSGNKGTEEAAAMNSNSDYIYNRIIENSFVDFGSKYKSEIIDASTDELLTNPEKYAYSENFVDQNVLSNIQIFNNNIEMLSNFLNVIDNKLTGTINVNDISCDNSIRSDLTSILRDLYQLINNITILNGMNNLYSVEDIHPLVVPLSQTISDLLQNIQA